MSWEWRQIGELWRNGTFESKGYSGDPADKNNPADQEVKGEGPIPRGEWTIVALTIENTPHGPYVLHLAPSGNTNTFGRSGFLIHGDSIAAPGTASKGCIILPRVIRERIWSSGDRQLTVV